MSFTVQNAKGRFSSPLDMPAPPPQGTLATVKRWGQDALMEKFGYSTTNGPSTNFQVVLLFVIGSDGKGNADQITLRLKIPRGDIDRLYAMQPVDEYTREQKMNWLAATYRGRPYLLEEDTQEWEWPRADYIWWGEMAYGGQKVLLLEEKSIFGKYRSVTGTFDCFKIAGFRASDWDKTHEEYPYLIQRATAVRGDNYYNDTPRGVIYAPLYDPRDWFFTGLAGWQPDAFYIPADVITI